MSSRRAHVAEPNVVPIASVDGHVGAVPSPPAGGQSVEVTTDHTAVNGTQAIGSVVADKSCYFFATDYEILSDPALSDGQKEYFLAWSRFIRVDPARSASVELLPRLLAEFVYSNWHWFWQREHRRVCFTRHIMQMLCRRQLTVSVARDSVRLFVPPVVLDRTWTIGFYRVGWDEPALASFRVHFDPLWCYLRWVCQREFLATEENRQDWVWRSVLDRFIMVGRPVFLEEDVAVLRSDIVDILSLVCAFPDQVGNDGVRAGDLTLALFVCRVHDCATARIIRGRDGPMKRCLLYMEGQYDGVTGFDGDGGVVTEAGFRIWCDADTGFESHWQWRRVEEVEWLLDWLTGDVSVRRLCRALRSRISGGTSADTGGTDLSALRPAYEAPRWEPLSLEA